MQINLFDDPHPAYLFPIFHCLRTDAGFVKRLYQGLIFHPGWKRLEKHDFKSFHVVKGDPGMSAGK
jgi:hypothetical protein